MFGDIINVHASTPEMCSRLPLLHIAPGRGELWADLAEVAEYDENSPLHLYNQENSIHANSIIV